MGKPPKDKLQNANQHHERQNNKKPMGTNHKTIPTVVPIKRRIMDGNAT